MCPYRAATFAFALPAIACQPIRPAVEARWTVDVTPAVSIEWDSDIDGYDLHDVRAAFLLDDGRIAVVDGGSAEIRWFDRDGAFVGRLGGDSIFRRIQDAVRGRGDTMIVRTMDQVIVRMDGKSGAVVSRIALPPTLAPPCFLSSTRPAADGSLLAGFALRYGRGCLPRPEGPRRDSVTLARFDPATGTLDTLAVLPGRDYAGSNSFVAFTRTVVTASYKDRFYVAETGADSIVAMRADGGRITVLRSGLGPVDVPQAVIEKAATWRYKRTLPGQYPRFAELLPDRSGFLWVRAYPLADWPEVYGNPESGEGGFSDWVVLSPEGGRIAQARTPPGLQVLEIGDDYIIGTVRDSDGLVSIRMFTLRKQA